MAERSYHPKKTVELIDQHKGEFDNLWMRIHYLRIKDVQAANNKENKKQLRENIRLTKDAKKVMEHVLAQRARALWERRHTHHLRVIEATLQTSLLPGLGAAHVAENSLSLHPLYGVPYLPASSMKGLVRHWVTQAYGQEVEGEDGQKKWVLDDRVKEYVRTIFGGEPGDENDFAQGNLQVDDAFLVGDFSIEPEVLTVHVPEYYTSDKKGVKQPPGDNQSPIPINFYAVKGTRMRFTLSMSKECEEDVFKLAIRWLCKAIEEMGLGAKTTSGYGQFTHTEDCTNHALKEIEQQMEQQRIEQEQKQAAIAEARRIEEARRQFEAMTPAEQMIHQIKKLAEEKLQDTSSKNEIFNGLWSLPAMEEQLSVALALKEYWLKTGDWNVKKAQKKQFEKVQRLRELLGEL